MEQALQLVPGWAAGWNLLALYREQSGNAAAAAEALRQVLRLDPDDRFGAALRLAACGAGPAVERTAEAYVEALFDAYAAEFDAALLQRLGYRVPERLAALVVAEMGRRGTERIGHAIDAGCGTGLLGERLRRHVSFLEGVDLSAGMLAEARRKGVYDRTAQVKLVAYLTAGAEPADLIAAADVLCYCGALAPVLAAAVRRLTPGGLLAFSLERQDGPEPMVVRESLRFAHKPGAVKAAVAAAGFSLVAFEEGVLRYDRGMPVAGLFVLASLPPATLPAAMGMDVELDLGTAAELEAAPRLDC